jgi:catechol 2,3-dioxygenase
VGAVRLQVSDFERSLAYYQEVLGLARHEMTSDGAVLGAHGAQVPLVRLQTAANIVPARRGAFGLYHFAILLPDRAALGRFASHVAQQRLRVGMADHRVSEAFYLWDPDGLGIEVYADRPQSSWSHRARELIMTTDPLDVEDVISSADGRPWDGMPAGTVVGHVHLHVGSLEDGEAFYHRALGFDKMVWSYPGALFLAAGGYHHHLGTNIWASGPAARDDEARLVDWELVVGSEDAVVAAAQSLRNSGYTSDDREGGSSAADPWGTCVRIVPRQDV